MKRTDELSKFVICDIASSFTKHFLILIVVGSLLLSATPVSAITVDGNKSSGEWNESWAYGQTLGTDYNATGPFGDRLVIKQGGFSLFNSTWYDNDPQDDAGENFNVSMATEGDNASGSDIKSLYMHFNASSDILYGLCEVYGIPGDLDGDGSISTNSSNGDAIGVSGPAGVGLGSAEIWKIRASQDGEYVDIRVSNNNWTVTNESIAMYYDDVVAKFASIENSCYEIEIHNITTFFDVSLGASPIMIEVLAGGNADGLGEDTATAFVRMPLPATIGDYVWNDTNNDGIQNGGESGIPGVAVELYNCTDVLIDTTITNATGYYNFTVPAGDYYVNFTLPLGMVFSPMDTGGNDGIDSDANITTGKTLCTTLSPGETNLTLDAGMYAPEAKIGDYVWNDTNKDGIQNVSESGIPGVTVDLMNGSSIIATDITNLTGYYLFENLVANCYDVVINSSNFESGNALFGHITSPANEGTDDAIDSDGINNIASVCVSAGDENLTIDFGYYKSLICTKTIGYWKNHPDDWPTESVTIGGETYTKAQAIKILKDANSKDATDMLAAQLIAAQLNIDKFGAGTSDILQIISDSNDFLILHSIGSNPQGDYRDEAIDLKDLLDEYNNLNDECSEDFEYIYDSNCDNCDEDDRNKDEGH